MKNKHNTSNMVSEINLTSQEKKTEKSQALQWMMETNAWNEKVSLFP